MTMEQNIRNIEGNVVEIQFKLDRNGKDFVTVTIQQDGLTYPTNVRARDATILERMKIVKQHLEAGSPVRLGFEIRESPRSEGGFFRDILRVTSVSLDDVPTDAPAPQSTPRIAQPSPAPSPQAQVTADQMRIMRQSTLGYAATVIAPIVSDFATPQMMVERTIAIARKFLHYVLTGETPTFEDATERPQEAPDGAPDISDDPLDEQGPYPEDEEGVYEV